jgi:hypothetical protein
MHNFTLASEYKIYTLLTIQRFSFAVHEIITSQMEAAMASNFFFYLLLKAGG